jgi:hypothetical protein
MPDHDDSREAEMAVSRIVLRPVGNPLPLGFLALAVATLGFRALQLGWVPPSRTARSRSARCC